MASELSQKLKKLMYELGTPSGLQFARCAGIPQTSVSEWIRGANVPSTNNYLKMAGLTRDMDLKHWFLEKAGISREVIMDLVGEAVEERGAPLVAGEIVRIPRYRVTEKGREEAGPSIPLPAEFIPHPEKTVCLLLEQDSPEIADCPHGLVLVDTSIENSKNILGIDQHVILIRYKPEGSTELFSKGLYMGRARINLMQHAGRRDWMQISLRLLSLSPWTPTWVTLGHYDDPQGLREIPYEDHEARSQRLNEILRSVGADFPLAEGVQILGSAIGRMTGHLGVVEAEKAGG